MERPELPPVVYLPCAEHVAEPADARPELRRTRDGKLALLVYSALDRLRTCCGPAQPWVVVSTEALQQLHDHEPFDLLLMDIPVPVAARSGGSW